jgi:hypothetical protein
MTWCYHQPRVVSLCRFTPIPFNIPVKQVSDDYDEELVSIEFSIVSLPMQSVPITTDIFGSNPAQARCARYNIM